MEQKMGPGGWSSWNYHPTEAAKKVFAASLGRLFGVAYTLLASTHQIVNGENYMFLCKAEPSTHPSLDYVAVAHVHVASGPHAAVTIQKFQQVGARPGTGVGAWSAWQFPVTHKALMAFEEGIAIDLFLPGKPVGFSQKIVNGIEYCFLYEAIYPMIIYILQPTHGKPRLMEVISIHQTDALFAASATTEALEHSVA